MGSNDGNNPNPSSQNKMKPTRLTLDEANLENGHRKESWPSNCESKNSCPDDNTEKRQQRQRVPVSGSCSRRQEENDLDEIIKRKFDMSMSSYGFNARIESIKRNHFSGVTGRAKFQSFNLYLEAMKLKRCGNPNLKYAWCGASKTEVQRIFSHRFALPLNSGEFGQGVYLSPLNHSSESMHSSPADENGLRHMILCRVILGNMEVVHPGSGQYNPSSEEFDSGVDNLVSPKKYIIWNGDMNTHILPDFLVSFRICTNDRGSSQTQRVPQAVRLPNSKCTPFFFAGSSQTQKVPLAVRLQNSKCTPFGTFVNELCTFLPPDIVKIVAKDHNEYEKQKITKLELIKRLRFVAGDKLLVSVMKYCKDKMKGCESSFHGFKKSNWS